MSLFLPVAARAYIKVTPRKTNATDAALGAGASLAGNLIPAFDTNKFIIDVVRTEEHTFENVIPQNPLEDGSFVNDHITNLPYKLTMDFVITDTPVDAVDFTYGRIDSGRGRSRDEFDKLEKMRDQNEPMTVVTGLKAYRNMVIESLTANRDNGGFRVLCRATFVQLQVAKSSTTGATSFESNPDDLIIHTITPGQALGLVALAAITLGA